MSTAIPRRELRPERVPNAGTCRAPLLQCRLGRYGRRPARDDFCLALNHLGRLAGPGIKHRLNCRDRLLDLLIAHLLDRAGMLDLHFPRHQERANLQVGRRLRLAHLFNRGRPVLFEVGSEREQEILVERSTRSLQGTARVSKANSEFKASPLPGGFTTAAYLSGPASADAKVL